MSDLHSRALAAIDEAEFSVAYVGHRPVIAALRAAVELHAPVSCRWMDCMAPATHKVCKACGPGVNAPCEEIQAIAEKLGVKDQERIEEEAR